MGAKSPKLLPKRKRILAHIGENIKLARLRRKFTTEQVANRANISRKTLWHVEKGSEHISIGFILKVLSVLGLEDDLTNIAKDDVLGRKLQDLDLITKKRGPKKVSQHDVSEWKQRANQMNISNQEQTFMERAFGR